MDRDELALAYLEQLPFPPYPFQEEAIYSWFSSKQGVLVCAPTGMGKTLIAEAGLYEALQTGKRAYYTTPLIALTEQKFREIQAAAERWGFDRNDVGLITGNRRVNPEAPILVVVAEILFNRLLLFRGQRTEDGGQEEKRDIQSPSILYPQSSVLSFSDVAVIVMDEFHNFADQERGIVWEFSLGLLPEHVRTLLISATVGNAYEFVAWLRNTTGRKLEMVQSAERKVPLIYQWVGDELLFEQLEKMFEAQGGGDEARLTPALVFCFDRNECWDVADQIRGRNVITPERQKELTGLLEQYDFKEGAGPKLKQLLLRGVGVHHAGVLPKYRRIVEELFQQKLLSICVCTETLAAGINLPARSVVLPSLMKGPPGEKKLIDSSSAHQIFGRAGRPQFDTQGFVFALAHEDDVKIARFRVKYDQIPEDTKDPKLREMKKKMKKKMPTRRATEQYWVESHFLNLQKAPPGNLTSRGEFPWRMLAHIITLDPDIATIRALVGRRLMGVKRLAAGQKELDHKLLTLWRGGYIQLDPSPLDFGIAGTFEQEQAELLARKKAEPGELKQPRAPEKFGSGIFEEESSGNESESVSAEENFSADEIPANSEGGRDVRASGSAARGIVATGNVATGDAAAEPYSPQRAYPTPKLPELLQLRGINPLYGLFLLKHFAIADRAERLQALESVLEMPNSIGRFVRVPKQDVMPSGPLARERLDPMLLELGLATVDELVEKTEEERKEEWEKRRRFGGFAEEPVFVLKLAEKLKRLFEYEYPGVEVRINPVWAAGEILLEFNGDFNKYITSMGLQKQEGIIFRHLQRLILLLAELAELTPPDLDPADWQAELTELGVMLIECCRKVDPNSTEETLNFAKRNDTDDAV